MKTSICVTVFNEEGSVGRLLDSILLQSKKADEIIIVDSMSTDKTAKIIKKFQKKHKQIKLIQKKSSRARGRNIAVQNAKNQTIAMTDAGCSLHKDWLENITKPIKNTKKPLVVAGFYKMVAKSTFQKTMSVFLGISPREFDQNFLPSTRSMAFTKIAWKKAGKFPENLTDTAEDTIFNKNAIKMNIRMVRVKKALVYWNMPRDIFSFSKKIFNYAKGDAKSKVFWDPAKGMRTHNIKVLLVFARYMFAFVVFILSFYVKLFTWMFIFGFFLYLLFSFTKIYRRTKDTFAGLFGIFLQIVVDLCVMVGFCYGFW